MLMIINQQSNCGNRTTYQSFFIVANASSRQFFRFTTNFDPISSKFAQKEDLERWFGWLQIASKIFWNPSITLNLLLQTLLWSHLSFKANDIIMRHLNHFLLIQTRAQGDFLVFLPHMSNFHWKCFKKRMSVKSKVIFGLI